MMSQVQQSDMVVQQQQELQQQQLEQQQQQQQQGVAMKTDQENSQLKLEVGRYSRDGTGHVNDGHPDKAIECFHSAYQKSRQLDNDQTERICAFNLGAAYIASGKYTEGIQFLYKATPPDNVKDGRSNGDLYYNMGYAYDGMGDINNGLKYYKLAYDEFRTERDNFQMEIECLSKLLQIYQKRSEFTDAADVYSLMSNIHGTTNDGLMQASCLCEMASNLRLARKQDVAETTADAAMKQMAVSESASNGLAVGKVYNDLGILYTQLKKYDNAATCFERALPLVRNASENSQLEAVITQNLGASYNFQGEYQRSIQYHRDASEKYAKLNNRNGQGQCFTNLAFAYSQLNDTENAEVTFYHALQAAKDTGDTHARWQVLEGLGAVKFNQGRYKQAADFLFEAHQCVGEENKVASQRIKNKLWSVMNVHGGDRTPYLQGRMGAERIQQPVHEAPIVPVTAAQSQLEAMPTGNQQMMSQVQPSDMVAQQQQELLQQQLEQQRQQQQGPRKIPMRKKDSVGPHLPKVARGFSGSIIDVATSSSPRYKYVPPEIEEETSSGSSETESSSSDSDDTDDSSSEEEEEQEQETKRSVEYKSPVVEEIFRPGSASTTMASSRPGSRMVSLKRGDLKRDHKLYEQMLLEQEEKEEEEQEEKKSSSGTSDSSDDSEETESESSAEESKDDKTEKKAPPLPTQSPPNTNDPNMATYLDPMQRSGPYDLIGSGSSHRRATGDVTVPYATVDFTRRTSSLSADKGMDEENPYYSLQFEREDTGELPQGIDSMPRATRDSVLYNEHKRIEQEQEPPRLPERPIYLDNQDKSSKTCTIM